MKSYDRKKKFFWGSGFENLKRVGIHILKKILIFFLKIYNFMHFGRHKIIFFRENLKKIVGFISKLRSQGLCYPKHSFSYLALSSFLIAISRTLVKSA